MAHVNASPKTIIFPFRPEDQGDKNTLRKSENETISPVDKNEKISTRKENSSNPKKEAKEEKDTKTKSA